MDALKSLVPAPFRHIPDHQSTTVCAYMPNRDRIRNDECRKWAALFNMWSSGTF
jgi:hypothetical protein